MGPNQTIESREVLLRASTAALLEKVRRAKDDFDAFFSLVWHDAQGRPVSVQPHQRPWLEAFDRYPRVLILAARSHGKTDLVTARALWELARNPNLRVKWAGQSDRKARQFLSTVKHHISHNQALKLAFPGLQPSEDGEWSKSQIVLQRQIASKDPSVDALGILSTVVGGRVDLLLVDDPQDYRSAVIQPQTREAINNKFYCLAEGSLVRTDKGLEKVEDLTPDSYLRISADEWDRPVGIARHWYDGELIEICLRNQAAWPIRCTPEHRFPTTAGLKLASEIEAGDLLLRSLPAKNSDSAALAALAATEPKAERRTFVGTPGFHGEISAERLAAELSTGPTYMRVAGRLGLSSGSRVLQLIKGYGLRPNARESEARPGFLQNPDFWRFLGYYLAEGSISDDRKGHRFRLVFGSSEEERFFAEDAGACLTNSTGISFYVSRQASCLVVGASNRQVRKIVSQFGRWSHTRSLPDWVFTAPQRFAQQLILGYWRGDGCLQGRPGITPHAGFTTASETLASDLSRLLATMGLRSSTYYTRPPGLGVLPGGTYEIRACYTVLIGAAAAHQLGIIETEPQRIRARENFDDPPVNPEPFLRATTFEVRSVERKPYHGWTYDIQTRTGYYDLAGVTSHNSEWLPTVEPSGRIWIIMTPWSRSDLSARIKKMPGWHVIETPVGTDSDPYEPLWEKRWPRAKLMEMREAWGPIDYDRAFRLKVLSDDVVPVRPHWVKYYDKTLLGNPDNLICACAFDLAISQAASADFFACAVVLYDPKRNYLFVTDAWHARLSVLEQARAVIETAAQWRADRVVIEQTNYEGALAQLVGQLAGSPIPIVTVRPKGNKQRRVMEITPLLEQGRVFFHPAMNPQKHLEIAAKGDLIGEMLDFPRGEHDDLLDALVYAVQALREYAPSSEEGAATAPGEIDARITTLGY